LTSFDLIASCVFPAKELLVEGFQSLKTNTMPLARASWVLGFD
jgi:hypothetical protein